MEVLGVPSTSTCTYANLNPMLVYTYLTLLAWSILHAAYVVDVF